MQATGQDPNENNPRRSLLEEAGWSATASTAAAAGAGAGAMFLMVSASFTPAQRGKDLRNS